MSFRTEIMILLLEVAKGGGMYKITSTAAVLMILYI